MSKDFPGQADREFSSVSGASSAYSRPYAEPASRKSRTGFLAALVLLAFGGGIGATLWILPKVQSWHNGDSATMQGGELTGPANAVQPLLNSSGEEKRAAAAPGSVPSPPVTSLEVATLEARLATVATKLDGVSAEADNAGSNAARAEGLLIAFAIRRALDTGAQLGYLENELRLRFGESQPRAVATVINAAQNPITLVDLQTELEDVAPELLGTGGEKADWWTRTRRELSNLIIIRSAEAPSLMPKKVIERVRLLLSIGKVNTALQEIERLPDHDKADSWLQKARQYNEARRALDVVEAAAILEPRHVHTPARPTGTQSMQVAPPPPAPATATVPATNAETQGNPK